MKYIWITYRYVMDLKLLYPIVNVSGVYDFSKKGGGVKEYILVKPPQTTDKSKKSYLLHGNQDEHYLIQK